MKILVSIICLIFLMGESYAQLTDPDLKSGKYIPSKHQDGLSGLWKSSAKNHELELAIQTTKQDVKKGDLNFSTDFFIVRIRKILHDGKDISKQFINPIEMLSLNGDNRYTGLYKDPITENNVKIEIIYIDSNTLQFSCNMPEMDVFNDPKKGTVFSEKPTILKNKR